MRTERRMPRSLSAIESNVSFNHICPSSGMKVHAEPMGVSLTAVRGGERTGRRKKREGKGERGRERKREECTLTRKDISGTLRVFKDVYDARSHCNKEL